MSLRTFVVVFVLALVPSFALAACGSDEDTSSSSQSTGQSSDSAEEAEENATPEQVRAEIGEVRAALDSALTSLKSGDAKAAENAVSEGYLQHFEKVEGPLEQVDGELNEKLEDSIREELRDKIRNGGSVDEITALVTEIKANLATAEQKLQ